jgi:ribosomal protein S18 acetylase RimI-like enzyme
MEGARPATAADLPRLVELHRLALVEIGPARGGELFSAREARHDPAGELAAAVTDPDQMVVIGEIDGWVAGYASAHLEALRDGSHLGVIDDLFVEGEAREVGVGEAMTNVVVGWCEERGCRGIDASVLPGDRATKNFFESFGFTARAITVHRPLPGSRDT